MIKCADLLKLDVFKQIKLVAGESGLDRIVTWPYVLQEKDVSKYVHGGELLFVSGIGLPMEEDTLKNVMMESDKGHLAGVVMLTGSQYIPEIPKEIMQLADQFEIPLFDMDWDVKFVDVTRAISNSIITEEMTGKKNDAFISKMIFSEGYGKDQVKEWADAYGVKIQEYFTVAIFSLLKSPNQNIKEDVVKMDMTTESIHRTIGTLLKEKNIADVSRLSGRSIVYFLSDANVEHLKKTMEYMASMQPILEKTYEQCMIIESFGRIYDKIGWVKKSYRDALKGTKLAHAGTTQKKVIYYDDLGIYRLLFEIKNEEEILKYRDDVLGELVEYDKKNNGAMMQTLKAFLWQNGNLAKTADSLFIHRNTLLYRIEKIKNLIQKDLEDPMLRLNLMNCMLIAEVYPFEEKEEE